MHCYQIVDTAFGYAVLVCDTDPFRLLALKLPQADVRAVSEPFNDHWRLLEGEHPGALAVARDLIRYFEGQHIEIPWDGLDLTRFTPSQQVAYRTVAQIPYG